MSHVDFRSLLLAPFAIMACGDSLAPRALPGTYALQRVAGDPLPAVVASNFYGTIIVFSETIRLELGGTGTVTSVSEIVPHDVSLPREGPSMGESEIRWVITKGRMQIEHDCGPGESCVPGPHLVGVLAGHSLRLRWGPQLSGRVPLDYLEVPAPQ